MPETHRTPLINYEHNPTTVYSAPGGVDHHGTMVEGHHNPPLSGANDLHYAQPSPAGGHGHHTGHTGYQGGYSKPHRKVDLNNMKRNMSIAKGFMDISLLMANANQLRQLIVLGNNESAVFYIVLTGLILSLILQVVVGIMLIMKERFNITFEEDQEAAELYNNITTFLVFLTLIINVFISSFGVNIKHPPPFYQQGIKGRTEGVGKALLANSTTNAFNNFPP